MDEDDIHDDDMDDDDDDSEEDEEDLPEFKITELNRQDKDEEAGSGGDILVQEKMIPSLAELVAFANKEHRPLSFEECVLKKVRVHETGVDISFEESLFTEIVRFDKAVFAGSLGFWETCFDKKAQFHGAVFKEAVSFDECLFRSGVNFENAVFENKATFTSCVFEGDLRFDNARFAADADFSQSTFRGRVVCRDARFERSADLANTTFEHPPDTNGSNLAEAQEIPAPVQEPPRKPYRKKGKKKREFNPWHELDKASKKTMTRRHLLRGLFRFLPEDKEES